MIQSVLGSHLMALNNDWNEDREAISETGIFEDAAHSRNSDWLQRLNSTYIE